MLLRGDSRCCSTSRAAPAAAAVTAARRPQHRKRPHRDLLTTFAAVNERPEASRQQPVAGPSIPDGVLDPEAYLVYMKEYTDLKDLLLDRTRQTAAAIALYLFLAASGEAALCALVGGGFSYAYLLWLFYDVDNYKPGDRVPMIEAEQIQIPLGKTLAKVGAGYQQALRPRLLVPTVLAAATAAVGARLEDGLPLIYDGCLLAGFLSYKIALLWKVVEDLSAKSGEVQVASKPAPVKVEDELDMYGRPKRRIALPTDALPEEEREKVLEAADALEKRNEAKRGDS